MIIFEFIFAWLAIFGASWIVADSKISLPVRLWVAGRAERPWARAFLTFLECPACTSFWMGLAVAILFLDLRWLALPFAFAACGISLLLFLAARRLER